MVFQLYLFSIVMTFLRPVELLAPELAVFRPMLVLQVLVLMVSIGAALSAKEMAASPLHLKLLGVFILVVGVSVTKVEGFGPGLAAMVEFAPTPMLFLTTVLNLTSMDRLRRAGRMLVICVVTLSGLSIYAYHTGYLAELLVYREGLASALGAGVFEEFNPIPAQDQSPGHLSRLRSFGFLNDPNDFAQVMVATLPLLLVFLRKGMFVRNLVVVGLPASALVYATYLTHSRGALLGLASLGFFGVKRRLGTLKTSILVTVAMTGAMALDFTGGRAYTADEESAGGRVDAWSQGMVMLRGNPFFGVGYGRFAEHHSHTAHNSFVLCFAELGTVGYFLWLGLIVLVFKQLNQAIEAVKPGQEAYQWALALRTGLVGFFTCAVFLSRAYHPPVYILLAFAIGAAYCSREYLPGAVKGRQPGPLAWRATTFWLEVGSIFFIYVIVVLKTLTTGKSI